MGPGDQYLDTLRELPGLHVDVLRSDPNGALVRVTSQMGSSDYAVEARANLKLSALGPILTRLERSPNPLGARILLAAPYITPGTAERLLEIGIEFADGAGNVHINGPAAYVLVLGKKPHSREQPGGLTDADLRLVFSLLAHPELRSATVRTLGSSTGISIGKISATLRKLADSNYVTKAPNGTLLLREPRRLLERWDIGYLEQLRPRLSPSNWKLALRRPLEQIAQEASEAHDVLIGGEHAAALLTGYIKPTSITLHVKKDETKSVAAKLGLAPTPTTGEIVIVERFAPKIDMWQPAPDSRSVSTFMTSWAHPILIRSELLTHHDTRLRAAAEEVFRDLIEPRLDDASP